MPGSTAGRRPARSGAVALDRQPGTSLATREARRSAAGTIPGSRTARFSRSIICRSARFRRDRIRRRAARRVRGCAPNSRRRVASRITNVCYKKTRRNDRRRQSAREGTQGPALPRKAIRRRHDEGLRKRWGPAADESQRRLSAHRSTCFVSGGCAGMCAPQRYSA
jgi:hypothetical protein